MQRHSPDVRRCALLAGACIALACVAAPAHANHDGTTYYSVSGDVASHPGNAFPIDAQQQVLDLGRDTMIVGKKGAGSFSATNGAQFKTEDLIVGKTPNGQGTVNIDGPGTNAVVTDTLSVGFANGQGQVNVTDGATLKAGAVEVGVNGTGVLDLDHGTLNTGSFILGAGGTLTGDGGEIHATGDVILAGTLAPGHSPGRVVISCDIIAVQGSKLILDVQSIGNGQYSIDSVVIGLGSGFDLKNMQVVFNFLGNTDPTAFAASGGFDLDNFLRSGNALVNTDLSQVFTTGENWTDVLDDSKFSAQSSVFDVSHLSLHLNADGTVGAVPEPATWALMALGLLALCRVRRSR